MRFESATQFADMIMPQKGIEINAWHERTFLIFMVYPEKEKYVLVSQATIYADFFITQCNLFISFKMLNLKKIGLLALDSWQIDLVLGRN